MQKIGDDTELDDDAEKRKCHQSQVLSAVEQQIVFAPYWPAIQ